MTALTPRAAVDRIRESIPHAILSYDGETGAVLHVVVGNATRENPNGTTSILNPVLYCTGTTGRGSRWSPWSNAPTSTVCRACIGRGYTEGHLPTTTTPGRTAVLAYIQENLT